MKQITIFFILSVAAVFELMTDVNSWPLFSSSPTQLHDGSSPNTRLKTEHELIASMQPSGFTDNHQAEAKPVTSNRMTSQETSLSTRRPSSQIYKMELSHPKDSALDHSAFTAIGKIDSLQVSPKDNIYRHNRSNTHELPNSYSDPDRLPEGSGAGPPRSDGKNRKSKLDDTEDSGDDGDDDADYDYKDVLDSGSGHGHDKTTSTRPNQVHAESSGRIQSNDFYKPFRPPATVSDRNSNQVTNSLNHLETTRPVISTRPPLRIPQTGSNSVMIQTTTFAPHSSTTAATTTTSKNLALSGDKKNETRGEVDYDYEDDTEDEDPEETSAFEDNDPSEMSVILKPASQHQSNSSTNNQVNNFNINNHKHPKTEITRQPVINSTSSSNLSTRPHSSTTTETTVTISYPRDTTQRPNIQPITTKPAITKPTVFSPTQMGTGQPGLELDEDEAEDLEDEETEDDEEEEDEEDNDGEEQIAGPGQTGQANTGTGHNQHTHLAPKPPIRTDDSSIDLPGDYAVKQQASHPILPQSPSQHKNGLFQPTTTGKPNVITANSAPNQVSFVPIYTTTTTATPTTRMVLANSPPKLIEEVETITSRPAFAQPNYVPTLRPTHGTTKSSIGDKSDYIITSPPSNPSPPSKPPTQVTSILQHDRHLHDNEDTLTRQIYVKAVEVYNEADKTIRAVWQALWPPNISFDSSAMEPLLNQPLFFMLALGGAVIGLVLLMMLVVYIITYQIQPKDDDSSSIY